jgi:hypothetical protein
VNDYAQRGVRRRDSVSLAAWSGQVVKISFEATNDATLPTRFYIDDVSVS